MITAKYATERNDVDDTLVHAHAVSVPASALSMNDDRVPPELRAWLAAGNQPTPYVRPGPTIDDVAEERSRRLGLGFDYDFGDARGVHRVGTTDADMKGWDEVAKATQAALALNAPETSLNVVTDTGAVAITALEWQRVLLAASAARQPLWAASFVLQAMNPIPADFKENSYWTAA